MAILLAVCAALSIGTADIFGSVAVRQGRVWATTLWIFVIGSGAMLFIAPFFGGSPTSMDWLLGALAGLASGSALLLLYLGYETSELGVVGPVAAVIGAIIPVLTGVLVDGAPPAQALVGMALGVVAVALIGWKPSGEHAGAVGSDDRAQRRTKGIIYGASAGLMYGFMSLGLGFTSDDAGIWPGAATRASAAVLVLFIALKLRRPLMPTPGTFWHIFAAALIASGSIAAFTLAAQRDVAVAGLLMQLGYGVSVLGAIVIFGERSFVTQRIGFALAIASVALISLAG